MNGGPRTRNDWATERATERGLYHAGLAGRAERAPLEINTDIRVKAIKQTKDQNNF